MTAALVLTALTVGYLAGRRSYRRKLQTTDGRRCVGLGERDFTLAEIDELLTPRTGEMPAVLMPAIAPRTRPQRTAAMPVQQVTR